MEDKKTSMGQKWFNKDNKTYLVESIKSTKIRINELKELDEWNNNMKILYGKVIKTYIQLARSFDDYHRRIYK